MKKILLILLMCFLFITVLTAQNITVVHPSAEFIKVETVAVKNIVQQNAQELKLANNTVKIYYTKEPEEFVVVRLSNSTYYVSFVLIITNGNDFNIKNNDYFPKMSDFELYQTNESLSKTTFQDVDFLFDTPENRSTAIDAINTASSYAVNQNYTRTMKFGSNATVENIQNIIINNDLIGMGNIGHGYSRGITLYNGNAITDTWFSLQDLSGTVFFFNSCETFSEYMISAIKDDGGARTFIGGAEFLPYGTSEAVFEDFWDYTLNNGQEMEQALQQAAGNYGLGPLYGFEGDEGIMNLTTNGNLRGNEIWSGNITVTGNVTVPTGKTLTIKEGTNITYQNNSKLIVNGTLNVNGTLSNKVTLNFVSPSSSKWYKV